MNTKKIAIHRLRNQQISQNLLEKPEDVVRHMTAIQAQDFYASLWAIGLRTSRQITKADILQAITDRKIVRTWPMRGTLHFVAADDVRWMLKLLTPRIIKRFAGRWQDLELEEADFTKSRKIIEKALENSAQLTRSEVYEVLENEGISTEGQRGYHILFRLAQEGIICWGPYRGKQHTLVLLDEWIQRSRELQGDEALAELASRYIKSHGPVSEYDFATWSGLTVTTSRKALQMVEKDFHKTKTEKHTWWFPEPIQTGQENSHGTYLLPGFDEMICGYKDRSSILTEEHEQSIILRNGILRPMIISDGKVMGSWKRTLKKDRVLIETAPFGTVTKDQERMIKEKAEAYASFLGKDAYMQG